MVSKDGKQDSAQYSETAGTTSHIAGGCDCGGGETTWYLDRLGRTGLLSLHD